MPPRCTNYVAIAIQLTRPQHFHIHFTKLSSPYLVSISLRARSSSEKRILLPLLAPPIVFCRLRCVTWNTISVQREGLHYTAIMSTATANGGDDELRSSSQQSPLASQRNRADNTPTEANRTGRIGGYFTLGYKEGFSQWVGKACQWKKMHYADPSSGLIYQLPRPNIPFCHIFRISSNLLLTHKLGSCSPPKPHQQHPSRKIAPTRPRLSKLIHLAIHTDHDNGIRLW